MGSLEEEKLFQMVLDFTEFESPKPSSSVSSLNPSLSDQTAKHLILQDLLRSGSVAENGVLEIVLKHLRNKIDAEKTTSLKEWLIMRLKLDGYNASLCKTCWGTTLDCPGDYEYIAVVGVDSMRLIVDIDFKSQFELARPTATYMELTDLLPSVFVGEKQKLKKVISLLCSAAKDSFRERGLHIPPWRTSTYMQSKWFSQSQKVPSMGDIVSSKAATKWAPPMVKPKRREIGSGSGLSSQFSNISTECC